MLIHNASNRKFLQNTKQEFCIVVLQYKPKKSARWKKYPGKDKLEEPVSKYDFRLLNSSKTKVLVPKSSYARVMKRFRAIEFFKHN